MQKNDCVVYVNGEIDDAASFAKFQAHLDQLRTTSDEARESVTAVFGTIAKGGSINMQGLISLATQRLGATPANFGYLSELVENYVRANTGENRESGAIFRMAKGKGGGVSLWADYVEKPAATAKK